MFLVAGLGNPGARYAGNRHNVGFMVVEEIARRTGVSLSANRFDGRIVRARLGSADLLLLEPMTYMNRSGGPVGAAVRFFKLEPADDLIVIHDELDLGFGVIRVKQGGGTAGHNGLKSIASSLGTVDFIRLRFGIGRPEGPRPVTDHVLSDFNEEEAKELAAAVDLAADAVETILTEGPLAAMNKHHGAQGPVQK